MPATLTDLAIQSVEPARVVTVSDDAELAALITSGGPVCDYGAAHRGLGHAPPAGHTQAVLPAGIVDHFIPDMAVRVRGGTTLGDLQSALAPHRQFLPLDADPALTIAEIIAHNVYGPLRLTHGSMRDLLLGLRFVDGAAQPCTVGGRTVKNVAGYDVTRLMVGNLNVLGLITEATLKTAAIPEHTTRITVPGFDPALLDAHLTALLISDGAPTALHHTNGALHVAYMGAQVECGVRYRALIAWLRSIGVMTEPQPCDPPTPVPPLPGALIVMAPPASTGRLVTLLTQLDAPPAHIHALPAHGIVHVHSRWSADEAAALDRQLLDWIKPHGQRLWLRRPDDTPLISPFAPPQNDWVMLRRIKQAMDPRNVLNPGRFI